MCSKAKASNWSLFHLYEEKLLSLPWLGVVWSVLFILAVIGTCSYYFLFAYNPLTYTCISGEAAIRSACEASSFKSVTCNYAFSDFLDHYWYCTQNAFGQWFIGAGTTKIDEFQSYSVPRIINSATCNTFFASMDKIASWDRQCFQISNVIPTLESVQLGECCGLMRGSLLDALGIVGGFLGLIYSAFHAVLVVVNQIIQAYAQKHGRDKSAAVHVKAAEANNLHSLSNSPSQVIRVPSLKNIGEDESERSLDRRADNLALPLNSVGETEPKASDDHNGNLV